jgi:hypothetical protein
MKKKNQSKFFKNLEIQLESFPYGFLAYHPSGTDKHIQIFNLKSDDLLYEEIVNSDSDVIRLLNFLQFLNQQSKNGFTFNDYVELIDHNEKLDFASKFKLIL